MSVRRQYAPRDIPRDASDGRTSGLTVREFFERVQWSGTIDFRSTGAMAAPSVRLKTQSTVAAIAMWIRHGWGGLTLLQFWTRRIQTICARRLGPSRISLIRVTIA
jgi:hypothetical protein